MPVRNLATTLQCLGFLTSAGFALAGEIDAGGLFAKLDANADGQLSPGEAGAEHRLHFSRLVRTGDENRDGQLTAEEFATALVPVRAEKAVVDKASTRLPGADALVVMLARMDVDGDSQLEAAEIPESYRPLYERMLARGDEDKNDRLDVRELARGGPRLGIVAQLEAVRMGIDVPAALEKLPKGRRAALEEMDAYPRVDVLMADPQQAGQLFNRLDANGDKQLTVDEAPGPLADRFAAMLARGDRDGDEQLSQREFLELARRFAAYQNADADAPQSRLAARQMLERFDRDGDKRLSRDEAPRRLGRVFDRADGNGDAQLDATELAVMAAQFSRMQQAAQDETSDAPAMGEPEDVQRMPAKKNAKKARRDRNK